MAHKGYEDELIRADARPDALKLRRMVAVYHEYYHTYGKAKEAFLDQHIDDIEAFQFAYDDPDRRLALVALCASIYEEPEFFFLVAAGPLEDILRYPDEGILARVVAEARKNARFRWMLTGVYLHAISDTARPEIIRAIGTMTEADPMPPR